MIIAAALAPMFTGLVMIGVAWRLRRRAAIEATWDRGGRWRSFHTVEQWRASVVGVEAPLALATPVREVSSRLSGSMGAIFVDKFPQRRAPAYADAFAHLWPGMSVFVPTVENVAEMVSADDVSGMIWLGDLASFLQAGLPQDWLFRLLERTLVYGYVTPAQLTRIPPGCLPSPRYLDRVQISSRDGSVLPPNPQDYEVPPELRLLIPWEEVPREYQQLLERTPDGDYVPAQDIDSVATELAPIPSHIWLRASAAVEDLDHKSRLAELAQNAGSYEAAFVIRRKVHDARRERSYEEELA